MRAWVTCHGSSLTRLRKAVQSQIKPSRNVPLTWMVIILWITSENLWHCKDVCLWDTLFLDEVFDQVLWTSSSLNSTGNTEAMLWIFISLVFLFCPHEWPSCLSITCLFLGYNWLRLKFNWVGAQNFSEL